MIAIAARSGFGCVLPTNQTRRQTGADEVGGLPVDFDRLSTVGGNPPFDRKRLAAGGTVGENPPDSPL